MPKNVLSYKYKILSNEEKKQFREKIEAAGYSYYNWYIAQRQQLKDIKAGLLFNAALALDINFHEIQTYLICQD